MVRRVLGILYFVCSDDELWIDAGRTWDTDDDNRRIDWKNGLVTVTVSPTCNRFQNYITHRFPLDTNVNFHAPDRWQITELNVAERQFGECKYMLFL